MNSQHTEIADTAIAEPGWKELYRLGGIAAIISIISMIISVAAFMIWPYAPGVTATENIFALVQENSAAALTALDSGVSVSNIFAILLYLALYVLLRQVNPSYALIALAFGLVGAASAIAARPIFEIFTLSDLHAAASTDLERSRYLAAGETLLVLFHGTAFKTYILLGGLSLLISSWLLLRSNFFGIVIAYHWHRRQYRCHRFHPAGGRSHFRLPVHANPRGVVHSTGPHLLPAGAIICPKANQIAHVASRYSSFGLFCSAYLPRSIPSIFGAKAFCGPFLPMPTTSFPSPTFW